MFSHPTVETRVNNRGFQCSMDVRRGGIWKEESGGGLYGDVEFGRLVGERSKLPRACKISIVRRAVLVRQKTGW